MIGLQAVVNDSLSIWIDGELLCLDFEEDGNHLYQEVKRDYFKRVLETLEQLADTEETGASG